MPVAPILIVLLLVATMVTFFLGRWRHDMVAVGALLVAVVLGLVPSEAAFTGFGHPAVITVACVLVLSRGLQMSGAVDLLTRALVPARAGPMVTIAILTAIGAVLSGFMNNVGALALLMPVALRASGRLKIPAGRILMPLSFGSILGGMTTLIGTPPNLIVSAYRGETGLDTFGMFDFTPVGLVVAGVGVTFVALFGRLLVPARREVGAGTFDIGSYLTEARVPEGSRVEGMTLGELEAAFESVDVQVVGLVRNEVRVAAPNPYRALQADDILVIEAEASVLSTLVARWGLVLEGMHTLRGTDDSVGLVEGPPPPAPDEAASPPPESGEAADAEEAPQEVVLMELVVRPGAPLEDRSARDLLLRTRFGISLLAVSRNGRQTIQRLRAFDFRAGDLLLMQGAPDALAEFASQYGCIPLARRDLRLPDPGQAGIAVLIMAVAIAGAAFGLLPAAITFAGGVLASMLFRTVPPRVVYEAIDWPVIVLLGALIPVAGALETTGAAGWIARGLLGWVAGGNAVVALALVMVVTMTLSDLINNAATAAIMCPIALGTAAALGVSGDPFLMAVAIGASCAFLTPIGHQNNTLILGPGGFRFGDYWRLGLPVQLLVLLVGLPLLLRVWPL